MVLRDLGLENVPPVVILVAKRPKSEEFLLLAGAKPLNAEDTTLCKAQVSYDARCSDLQPMHSKSDDC